MTKHDPRIDAYIAKSAAFARPILSHLRKLVHAGCPAVEETMKWSFPHFDYKGMLCSMAAFNHHCSFGFWKSALIFDSKEGPKNGMGQFGRLTRISDLPDVKTLLAYIRKAVQLNEAGIKLPARSQPKEKERRVVPDDLRAALQKNEKASAAFESFSSSHREEYVQWITSAKREATRKQRLAKATEWLAKGKTRNWKYLNC